MTVDFWTFLGGMFGTRAIEITAVLCGLVNVGLIIRRSIWNYPFGLVLVALYAKIFFDYKLYSDAGLQVFFFVIQIFGLYWWLRGRGDLGELIVLRLDSRQLTITLGTALVASLGLGIVMACYTDAALPHWDALIATLSVTAQYLLSRRYLESWYFWIVVDIVAVGVYIAKELQLTAVLYLIFLCLAVFGLLQWQRAFLRAQVRSC